MRKQISQYHFQGRLRLRGLHQLHQTRKREGRALIRCFHRRSLKIYKALLVTRETDSHRLHVGREAPFRLYLPPLGHPFALFLSFVRIFTKYSGRALSKLISSPVTGCMNPRYPAWRSWPPAPSLSFLGPYIGSPATGCPI